MDFSFFSFLFSFYNFLELRSIFRGYLNYRRYLITWNLPYVDLVPLCLGR